jgi:hypothetical protein
MNLEENEETKPLISLVKTINAPMVTRRVQSLLVRDEDASDDWFLGLKARHWICVAGKKEGAWDGRKTCVQH